MYVLKHPPLWFSPPSLLGDNPTSIKTIKTPIPPDINTPEEGGIRCPVVYISEEMARFSKLPRKHILKNLQIEAVNGSECGCSTGGIQQDNSEDCPCDEVIFVRGIDGFFYVCARCRKRKK